MYILLQKATKVPTTEQLIALQKFKESWISKKLGNHLHSIRQGRSSQDPRFLEIIVARSWKLRKDSLLGCLGAKRGVFLWAKPTDCPFFRRAWDQRQENWWKIRVERVATNEWTKRRNEERVQVARRIRSPRALNRFRRRRASSQRRSIERV